jgi:hypothetical protein
VGYNTSACSHPCRTLQPEDRLLCMRSGWVIFFWVYPPHAPITKRISQHIKNQPTHLSPPTPPPSGTHVSPFKFFPVSPCDKQVEKDFQTSSPSMVDLVLDFKLKQAFTRSVFCCFDSMCLVPGRRKGTMKRMVIDRRHTFCYNRLRVSFTLIRRKGETDGDRAIRRKQCRNRSI